MNFLRQSTGVSITLGPFISPANLSGTTGTYLDNVVLAGTSCGLIKANSGTSVSIGGRTFEACTGCSGYYRLDLSTADTGVTGPLKVFISGSSEGSNSFAEVTYDGEVVGTPYYDWVHADISGVSVNDFTTTAEASINAEVLDVLNNDTWGEPIIGTLSATTSIVGKIGYIYKFLRNKVTNDGTYIKVFNDDTATVDHKAAVAKSGGTVTRSEFASGA